MDIDFKSSNGLSHYYKGHTYGQCYADSTSNLMYINIPKNASTWTKDKIQNSNVQSNYNNIQSDNPINQAYSNISQDTNFEGGI